MDYPYTLNFYINPSTPSHKVLLFTNPPHSPQMAPQYYTMPIQLASLG